MLVSESEANRKPVTNIVWTKSKGYGFACDFNLSLHSNRENYIILIGGAKPPSHPNEKDEHLQGIVVVSGKKLRKNSDRRRLWFIESVSGNVVDFSTVYSSPWQSQTGLPQFIIKISINSSCR